MKRLAVLLAALSLAPAASATGWYDENGYHHEGDEGESLCAEHGGHWGTDAIPGGYEDGVPIWYLVVYCQDGQVFVVGPGYGVAPGTVAEYVPPPEPGEAWQDNPCYPPERLRLR